jgi:hypothetical protein
VPNPALELLLSLVFPPAALVVSWAPDWPANIPIPSAGEPSPNERAGSRAEHVHWRNIPHSVGDSSFSPIIQEVAVCRPLTIVVKISKVKASWSKG